MVAFKFLSLMIKMWRIGLTVSPTHSNNGSEAKNESSYYSEENPHATIESGEAVSHVVSTGARSIETGVSPSQTHSPPSQESIHSNGSVHTSKSQIGNAVAAIIEVLPIPEIIKYGLSDTQILETLKLLRTPFVFMVYSIILTIIILSTLGKNSKNFKPAFDEWGNCVLHHYDGTDNSWVPSCGLPPSEFTLSMQNRMLQIFVLSGNSIIISVIAAPSTFGFLYRCWHSYQNRRRY